ncbi:hypothetical protein ASPVEDRAFT_44980 [Aspergillus versicolor CBS 583.65]|uniref:Histidine-specific methyltransferase SAM-dependent domain-containing protein n=1 Tax=Aspergillus versicolor CBS 583.65 TaxID=1036611 RepID=A0A1L9PV96_ASPVE|nr:uncharacterized protein ASPVEDRAFT_44980 [Aspergillus versicolor CBS 583.65]OJJ05470.1 hypothetical protein ASPVEDRAFT_44980 [Aspergillus versicolor CBS 583.65]
MASTAIDNTLPSAGMVISSKLDSQPAKPSIIDIRQGKAELCMHDEIIQGLQTDEGTERTLPTMLLYDEKGLQLFEAITFLDEVIPDSSWTQ